MKAFKILIGIILAASFASCEEGRSRADIEKDFEGVDDLSPDYQMTTVDKRTASSEDPHAFNGSTDELEEKKKQEEQQRQQEAAKAVTVSNTNTTSEGVSTVGEEVGNTVANTGSESTTESKPATTTTTQQTTAPAKTTTEPAKTTQEQPARQQVIVNKSEPKKQDVVVDGQAQ